jgi:DNA-binding YbaB/EbfC family protein
MMPGMPDLSQILMQAQQMQADMERAQASLAEAEVTGHAGNGLVTVVVNGSGDLQRIRIDPSVVDPADVETLEDLVIAAVHDARRAAEKLAGDAMGSVAGGLDLSSMGLGGMGFPGFGAPAEIEGEDDDDADYLDDDEDDDADDMDVHEEVAVIEESAPPELPRPGAADLPATPDGA